MSSPSKDQAYQFAVVLSAGAPAREAIRYFLPEDSETALAEVAIAALASRWLADKGVQRAMVQLQGKDWEKMSTEEKLRFSVDKTYVEMAYFLYSRNYVELSGPEKLKADTCRTTLEAKLAGTAGKLSAVEEFWADVTSGRIKLSPAGAPAPAGPGPEGAKGRSSGPLNH